MLQKKVDTIDKKIEELNAKKQKIETDVASQLVQIIKAHSGFTLPFHALVGGLIEVIQTCKSAPGRMEEWQSAGEKFQRSRLRSKSVQKNTASSTPKVA